VDFGFLSFVRMETGRVSNQLCPAKVTVHQEKENTSMARQKKETDDIPDVTQKVAFERKT